MKLHFVVWDEANRVLDAVVEEPEGFKHRVKIKRHTKEGILFPVNWEEGARREMEHNRTQRQSKATGRLLF